MIIEILFVVTMFLWALASLPVRQVEPYAASYRYFAFVAVLLLGLYIFAPGLR